MLAGRPRPRDGAATRPGRSPPARSPASRRGGGQRGAAVVVGPRRGAGRGCVRPPRRAGGPRPRRRRPGRNPLALAPLLLRGAAFTDLGQAARALGAYRKATEVQPDNPAAWRALAWFLGDGPEAREAWARVRVLDPQDPRRRCAPACSARRMILRAPANLLDRP